MLENCYIWVYLENTTERLISFLVEVPFFLYWRLGKINLKPGRNAAIGDGTAIGAKKNQTQTLNEFFTEV